MMAPIPPQLLKRPRHRGLPVPYIAQWLPGQPPIFSANDAVRLKRVAELGLCALDGERLEYRRMAFIGSRTQCYRTHTFPEPAMHVDCAVYAAAACPYLANPDYVTTNVAIRAIERQVEEVEKPESSVPPIRRRSEWLGIYVTRGYKLRGEGMSIVFKAAPPVEIWQVDEPEGRVL